MIEQITAEELDEKCKKHVSITVTDIAKAIPVLENELHTKNYVVDKNNIIKLSDYIDCAEVVSNALFQNGVGIKDISIRGDDLETYFTNLIGGK